MNTNRSNQWSARAAALAGSGIDDSVIAGTHARLLARLEEGAGVTWQEVIEAPVEMVWEAAAAGPNAFFRHLPGVTDVMMISGSARPRYIVERDLAGVIDRRIGEVLISVEGSMICASDLDANDLSCSGALPTVYSLSMHDHPARAASSVLVFAGVTLGVHNPWLMHAFANHCRSVRETLAVAESRGVHAVRFAFDESANRVALGSRLG